MVGGRTRRISWRHCEQVTKPSARTPATVMMGALGAVGGEQNE